MHLGLLPWLCKMRSPYQTCWLLTKVMCLVSPEKDMEHTFRFNWIETNAKEKVFSTYFELMWQKIMSPMSLCSVPSQIDLLCSSVTCDLWISTVGFVFDDAIIGVRTDAAIEIILIDWVRLLLHLYLFFQLRTIPQPHALALCSHSWNFSQLDLHAPLIKDFCPCYKPSYLQHIL